MSTRSTIEFLKTETGSGLLLAAAAVVALAWANSPWAGAYLAFVDYAVPVRVGPFFESMSVGEWVRTALMPVFFFVMGLEIKHEVVRGELSNPRRLALPVLAALGGVAVPALAYLALNAGPSGRPEGWASTAATDTAFALAALTMVGRRLPPTLRTFLLTIAVVNVIAAVGLIAVLFTEDLRFPMLAGAAATLAVMAAMGRWRTAPYVFWAVGAVLLWGFTLKAGVDTSIAGVALALCFPLEPKRPGRPGVLAETLEALHPYVAFAVLPLFALTAAGFRLGEGPDFIGPVSLGVALALVVAKPLGVFGAAFLAIALKWARRPTGAKWLELVGVSALCGVGFTMALYIGELAFPVADASGRIQVRAGVVIGSALSAVLGVTLLAMSAARRAQEPA